MYFINGIHTNPSSTMTPAEMRPTCTSCRSVAAGRPFDVLGGEHAVHDVLVGTPIPDAEDRRAEDDPCPREVGVTGGLPHREESCRDCGFEPGEPADAGQTDRHERDGTEDQDDRLQ